MSRVTMSHNYYDRRVFKVRAVDSPNVRLGLQELEQGKEPSNTVLVPGMITFAQYQHRRRTWDKQRQSVGLDAEFYEGAEVRMYPDAWLAYSVELWHKLRNQSKLLKRTGKGLGCDPAEGGDHTTYSAIDELGLLELIREKTPNTAKIVGNAMGIARRWGIDPKNIYFDRGGGGKQHADYLNAAGYAVRSIGFGEAVVIEPKRGMSTFTERVDVGGDRMAFLNRRALMYWDLRQRMDPEGPYGGFALPPESEGPQYAELHRQLQVFPLLYDQEGKIRLPPKRHLARTSSTNREPSIEEMLGCSPDETDSLVLAVHAMTAKGTKSIAGAVQ